MKNLFNNLSEQEKRHILGMHYINEQQKKRLPGDYFPNPDEKYGHSAGPGGRVGTELVQTVTMDGSLFENGIDKIDKNSSEYQKGVSAIQSKGSTLKNVEIQGGASAVGNERGYDNEGLARRRAQNFINTIKAQFPNINFTITTKVGTATVRNSPEARKEQFVKIIFPGSLKAGYDMPAVDKTQQVYRPGLPPEIIQKEVKKIKGKTWVKVCVWIPEENFDQFIESSKKYNIRFNL